MSVIDPRKHRKDRKFDVRAHIAESERRAAEALAAFEAEWPYRVMAFNAERVGTITSDRPYNGDKNWFDYVIHALYIDEWMAEHVGERGVAWEGTQHRLRGVFGFKDANAAFEFRLRWS